MSSNLNRAVDSAEHKVAAVSHGIKETGHHASANAQWEAAKNPNLTAGQRISNAAGAAGEKMKEGAEATGRNYEEMRSWTISRIPGKLFETPIPNLDE